MKITGRKEEIKRLKSYYNSGKYEFIAMYGRRRVGKTFLIEQLFSGKFTFCVTGVIDGSRNDELTVFHTALKGIGYDGSMPKNWYDAFFILQQLLEKRLQKNKRQVIFIDELPCFDTANSRFVKAFGNFWNGWCTKHPEVMLIVCGSATTWMVKNIVDSHGGLHNRITHELHLHPFTLAETEEFLKSGNIMWDRLAIIQIYSVLGGVPYYLSLIENSESVSQSVDRLFFSQGAEMKDEYSRLLKSLYKRPEPYIKILDLLCSNKSGLTREEISSRLDKNSSGHLSEQLTYLEKCDFLRLYHIKDRKRQTEEKRRHLSDYRFLHAVQSASRPPTLSSGVIT